jgi:hypothetical protein
MKTIKQVILFSGIMLINSCIVQFIPETTEGQELLVVEGLITDQPGVNIIKLSKSQPLGEINTAKPIKGCSVLITVDEGISYRLTEIKPGIYITDSTLFRGKIGSKYTLRINTNNNFTNNNSFESIPMEMKPVPPIDSIYYEKKTLGFNYFGTAETGCQVYLNTSDPTNNCQFYRWDYNETWEFRLPYLVTNRICWVTNNSAAIYIKNTSVFDEDKISRYPLNFISNKTDRLNVKYSILVNQYSISEDEYIYWEKLQSISEEVGSLYDITPAAIPSNIRCVDDPNEQVLGYFSVSARSSKRIFIRDSFSALADLYTDCLSDTIPGPETIPIPGLNESVWVVITMMQSGMPPYRVITEKKGCADCSVRGTTLKPLFWRDDK